MSRRTLLVLCCSAPLLWSACGGGPAGSDGARGAATATPASPATGTPAQRPAATQAAAQAAVVTAVADEARVPAGGSGESIVRLRIAEGYHVNSNPPSDKFYVGTEIRAEPQGGIRPGKAVYPKGESKTFQFSDRPLSVYEGEAVIRLPLSAAKDAAKGRHNFAARVRVQPCNDEACLPPRDVEASIPVVVE